MGLVVLQTSLIVALTTPAAFPRVSNLALCSTWVLVLYILSQQRKIEPTVAMSFLIGTLGTIGMVVGALLDPPRCCVCSSNSLLSFSTLGMIMFCTLACTLFSSQGEPRFTCLRRIVVSGMLMAAGMVIAKWLIGSSLSLYLGAAGGNHWAMFSGMLLGTFLAERIFSGAIIGPAGEAKIAGI